MHVWSVFLGVVLAILFLMLIFWMVKGRSNGGGSSGSGWGRMWGRRSGMGYNSKGGDVGSNNDAGKNSKVLDDISAEIVAFYEGKNDAAQAEANVDAYYDNLEAQMDSVSYDDVGLNELGIDSALAARLNSEVDSYAGNA